MKIIPQHHWVGSSQDVDPAKRKEHNEFLSLKVVRGNYQWFFSHKLIGLLSLVVLTSLGDAVVEILADAAYVISDSNHRMQSDGGSECSDYTHLIETTLESTSAGD